MAGDAQAVSDGHRCSRVHRCCPYFWHMSHAAPPASTRLRFKPLRIGVALLLVACGDGDPTGTAAPVSTVELSPTMSSVLVGGQVQLTAVVRGPQGQVLPGRSVNWATDDPSVVSVTSDGLVRALALGMTTVTATSEGQSGAATVHVIAPVLPPSAPVIETSALVSGQVGEAYADTLSATGGVSPYVWSVLSGGLPAGLSLTPDGGVTGTPTDTDTTTVTVRVEDQNALADTAQVSIEVAATSPPSAPVIETSALVSGQVGEAYADTLSATGGLSPYTWSVLSGALPAGLSLTPDGGVTGTPTDTDTTTVTVRVEDQNALADTAQVSIEVAATSPPSAPVIETSALVSGQVGEAYADTLSATGGLSPYTWSVLSGALPAGLSLAPDGVVTGTPTATDTTTVTVRVEDQNALADTAQVSIELVEGIQVFVTGAVRPIGVGEELTLRAVAVTTAGDTIVPASWTWISADPSVALTAANSLDWALGQVWGLAPGATTVTVRASTGQESDPITIDVDASLSLRVEVTPASDSIGGIGLFSDTITARVLRNNGDTVPNSQVRWGTTDPGVLLVSGVGEWRRASAQGTGTAYMTAERLPDTYLNFLPVSVIDSAFIFVGELPVGMVTITPDSLDIVPGVPTQLGVDVFDTDGNTVSRSVTWTDVSSTQGGITVTSAGVLTGISAGTYLVEATSETVSDTATVVVLQPDPYVSLKLQVDQAATLLSSTGQGYLVRQWVSPLAVAPLSGGFTLQQVASGLQICGVTDTGAGYCWPDIFADISAPAVLLPGGLVLTQLESSGTSGYAVCGVTTSNEVHCWPQTGSSYGIPTRIGGTRPYVRLAGGVKNGHDCAIATTGEAYCWGANGGGQLGDGTLVDAPADTPVLVAGGQTWEDLTIGDFEPHTCGITTTGSLYCWGLNTRGQLGVGTGSASCGINQFFGCTPDVTQSSVPLLADASVGFVPGSLSSDRQGSLRARR